MFQSIKIGSYLSKDQKSSNYWRCEYTLVDSEFGSVTGAGINSIAGAMAAPSAIIIEYRKRKLNVEANLLKYLLYVCRRQDYELISLLARFDTNSEYENSKEFAALWKTIDQSKIMKYAVLI